jgi:hypothetical protein
MKLYPATMLELPDTAIIPPAVPGVLFHKYAGLCDATPLTNMPAPGP